MKLTSLLQLAKLEQAGKIENLQQAVGFLTVYYSLMIWLFSGLL